MVVNIMKWSAPREPMLGLKKFQVKVRPRKLEGLDYCFINGGDQLENDDVAVVLEMKWNGPNKTGLQAALPRASKTHQKNVTAAKILRKGSDVEWEEEFERVCSFSMFQKDTNSFGPWDVSFNLLYGLKGEPLNKLRTAGTVSLNVAELASQTEPKLPVALQFNGVKATLLVSVGFVEMRSETAEIDRDESVGAADQEGFFGKVRGMTVCRSKSKKKVKKTTQLVELDGSEDGVSNGSDESTVFDSEGLPYDNSLGSSGFLKNDGGSDSASKGGFWKKRRLSFRSSKKKEEPLICKTNVAEEPITSTVKAEEGSEGKLSSESDSNAEEISVECWEEKDLVSRDGRAKLQAEIFFASIDQRSEKAAGESACTALVAVIANWLQSNRDAKPTRSEFDGLIVEGSSEWQKLCKNEAYIKQFPDKHFDLDTVLAASLRPLSVIPNKSFVGFFFPERFESLKGAMSFDEIWDEISKIREGGEPSVYIVSWNDHFFLLKMEGEACYIIDSLGERLFEGCNQAYVLKFSDKTRIYSLAEKQEGSPNECEELVCSGKECCREYFKRFLAAIPLRELEMEEKKSTLPCILLHQRLQIEFHFCTDSSSSSSSSGNSDSS